jgi:oxidase EvaA
MNILHSWLEESREKCDMRAVQIPRSHSREWQFDGQCIYHRTNRFFKIIGIECIIQNHHGRHKIEQPLIDQPEIGILGFLIQKHKDGIRIMVQAKPEPGNIGLIQAAPSVQATESNYQKVHNGKETPFLDHFTGIADSKLISDSLQSEQGSRFLSKYNRNMLVELPSDVHLDHGKAYKWVDVRELLELLSVPYQVNTDARSVLVSSSWKALVKNNVPFDRWRRLDGLGAALLKSYEPDDIQCFHTIDEIQIKLANCRQSAAFKIKQLALSQMNQWAITSDTIKAVKADGFEVRHYEISTSEREVSQWDQPLVCSLHQGVVCLFAQIKNGLLHFLFNCRPEPGFKEYCQFGPTIQDLKEQSLMFPGHYKMDIMLKEHLSRATCLISCPQSDEGGRFYHSTSDYKIVLLNKEEEVEYNSYLCWMSLRQIEELVKIPANFNNEARSLISMLMTYL